MFSLNKCDCHFSHSLAHSLLLSLSLDCSLFLLRSYSLYLPLFEYNSPGWRSFFLSLSHSFIFRLSFCYRYQQCNSFTQIKIGAHVQTYFHWIVFALVFLSPLQIVPSPFIPFHSIPLFLLFYRNTEYDNKIIWK